MSYTKRLNKEQKDKRDKFLSLMKEAHSIVESKKRDTLYLSEYSDHYKGLPNIQIFMLDAIREPDLAFRRTFNMIKSSPYRDRIRLHINYFDSPLPSDLESDFLLKWRNGVDTSSIADIMKSHCDVNSIALFINSGVVLTHEVIEELLHSTSNFTLFRLDFNSFSDTLSVIPDKDSPSYLVAYRVSNLFSDSNCTFSCKATNFSNVFFNLKHYNIARNHRLIENSLTGFSGANSSLYYLNTMYSYYYNEALQGNTTLGVKVSNNTIPVSTFSKGFKKNSLIFYRGLNHYVQCSSADDSWSLCLVELFRSKTIEDIKSKLLSKSIEDTLETSNILPRMKEYSEVSMRYLYLFVSKMLSKDCGISSDEVVALLILNSLAFTHRMTSEDKKYLLRVNRALSESTDPTETLINFILNIIDIVPLEVQRVNAEVYNSPFFTDCKDFFLYIKYIIKLILENQIKLGDLAC